MFCFYFSIIRLEFCHDLCEYYTELDAVCLYGDRPQGQYIMSGLEGVTFERLLRDINETEQKLRDITLQEQVMSNRLVIYYRQSITITITITFSFFYYYYYYNYFFPIC